MNWIVVGRDRNIIAMFVDEDIAHEFARNYSKFYVECFVHHHLHLETVVYWLDGYSGDGALNFRIPLREG